MNAPLRRVGVVVMIMFGLLFANLNWVQAYKASEYRNSPYNSRVQIAEYQRERGLILVGRDAQAVTGNVETEGRLRYQRTYPLAERYAHVVGYRPVNGEAAGIERFENEFLAGNADTLFVDRLRDLFTEDSTPGGNVLTTLSAPAQQTAYEELRDNHVGARRGAVVALDPRTGAVQALVSMPSFNPNPLASHDGAEAEAAYQELTEDPDQPLRNRALSERYPPGSVFKIIDAAAALERGYTPQTEIPAGRTYQHPETTHVINNAGPSICPEAEVTLIEALTESCNTGFARLAVDLGADAIAQTAEAFGFGDDELTVGRLDGGGMPVAESRTGDLKRDDGQDDGPVVALSGIGQANVEITPMQGALIAAAVANNGVQMRPYLVQELQHGRDLSRLYLASPEELRRATSPEVAAALRDMMVSVVENGTGRNAAISGHVVGGKTGTAQTVAGQENHGWFVGFVIADGVPVSAVAVFLENAGDGGSAEAARIAGQVMRAVLADRGEG